MNQLIGVLVIAGQSLRARQRKRLPMAFEKIPNKIDPKRAKG